MSLVSIIGPRPNLFDLQGLASTKRLEVRQPILTDADLEKIRSISDVADTPFQVAHARHHLPRRLRRGGHGAGARRTLRARRRRGARGRQHHHPVRPHGRHRPDSDPVAARLRRRASSSDPHRPAHLGRARGRIRRAARGASLRLPGRLRRRSDQPLSRVRDHHRDEGPAARRARRLRDRQALHQVDRQGPAEGDVQDGHLDLPVLLRRADLRRRRPEGGFRREVFCRHPHPHRGRRPCRNRRGDRAPPRRRVRRRAGLQDRARRRRRICLPHPRRGPRLDRRIGLDAAACRARQFAGALPRVRQDPQRAVRAAADAARPVPDQDAPRTRSASRSRSTRSSRPRTSSSASPPARCASARSRARRTPRSRSP